jgi:formylglycine-generating enzyme required for sulfatase activity
MRMGEAKAARWRRELSALAALAFAGASSCNLITGVGNLPFGPGGGSPASSAGGSTGLGGGSSTGVTGGAGTGGASMVYPSCQGLDPTCGKKGENCCTSLHVTGGTLVRSENGSTTKVTATEATFRLDRYEVTVNRFRTFFAFLKGGGHITPAAGAQPDDPSTGWNSAWDSYLPVTDAALQCDPQATWTTAPTTNEHLPINCVDWYAAFAFCAWDQGRLPTEAEWQYAATTDSGGMVRTYPWGETAPDLSHAVYCTATTATDTNPCASTSAPPIAEVGSTWSAGDGPWGHVDMAGNMWEWVLDAPAPYPSTCTSHCYNFTEASNGNRGIRGGSYLYGEYYLPGGLRTSQPETTMKPKQGIRCARAL